MSYYPPGLGFGQPAPGVPAYWVKRIASTILPSGGTAKTLLAGGGVYNTGAVFLVDGDARSIVAVRPKVSILTPTANQAFMGTLKIESGDLHLGDYEVLANPIDSGLGTNETQFQDAAPWWPCNFVCKGGESVSFYGTPQISNSASTYMSVDVLLSDSPGASLSAVLPQYDPVTDYSKPYQAKIPGINSTGGPTATGTAAASVGTDGGIQLGGPNKLMKAMIGVLVGTTPAASKPVLGTFQSTEGQYNINPQIWEAEPITGFLGTTTAGTLVHLSKMEGLNLKLRTPAKPIGSFNLDVAITTAGNFEIGYIYQDQ